MTKKVLWLSFLLVTFFSCKKSSTELIEQSEKTRKVSSQMRTTGENSITVGDFIIDPASYEDAVYLQNIYTSVKNQLIEEHQVSFPEVITLENVFECFDKENDSISGIAKTIFENDNFVYALSFYKNPKGYTDPFLVRTTREEEGEGEVIYTNINTGEEIIIKNDRDNKIDVTYSQNKYHPTYNWQGVADCIQDVYSKRGFFSVGLFIATAFKPVVSVGVSLYCLGDNLPTGG